MSAPTNYPTTPTQQPPRRKGVGLGVAALTLGILGFILCWIPFVGIVGIILGFIGAILGAIGFFVSHRWMSLVGFVLALVAIIAGFASTAAGVSAVDKQLNTPPTVQEQPGGAQSGAAADTYQYKVTGNGTVSYGTMSGSGMSMSQDTAHGSWTKSFSVTDKGAFFMPSVTVTSSSGGTVTCEVLHNGKSVSKQSAHGEFATANCNGN